MKKKNVEKSPVRRVESGTVPQIGREHQQKSKYLKHWRKWQRRLEQKA
jgi:hypothetical protein